MSYCTSIYSEYFGSVFYTNVWQKRDCSVNAELWCYTINTVQRSVRMCVYIVGGQRSLYPSAMGGMVWHQVVDHAPACFACTLSIGETITSREGWLAILTTPFIVLFHSVVVKPSRCIGTLGWGVQAEVNRRQCLCLHRSIVSTIVTKCKLQYNIETV